MIFIPYTSIASAVKVYTIIAFVYVFEYLRI